MIPVISIVGKSNSGKTTLLEKLIPELSERGYGIGTIKHDAHRFDIDIPGKDSWRHANAGAKTVVISSSEKIAMIKKINQENTLDELISLMGDDIDIVITEGYKSAGKPKIEVLRKERSNELICSEDELIAIATDLPLDIDVPVFEINDVKGIADFVEIKFLKKKVAK